MGEGLDRFCTLIYVVHHRIGEQLGKTWETWFASDRAQNDPYYIITGTYLLNE